MANEKITPEVTTPQKSKTLTKWKALGEAKVVPTEIVCDGYRPAHPFNLGCHSRLRPDVDQMVRHVEGGHGGGFMMRFRKGDKPWPGWAKMEELGLESTDFRCEVCDAVVPFHPMHILKHMRPHTGKQRRVLPGGAYNLTLNIGLPTPTEEEAFEDFE